MLSTKFNRSSSLWGIAKKELGLSKKLKRTLNQTDIAHIKHAEMKSVVRMSCLNDINDILQNTQHKISFMGTHHTMGGHTLVDGGVRIDTKTFNKILGIDLKAKTVTVEPGLTWSDLIVYLNNYGMSPKTIQSYSGFSIGGSIFGPNAHGILSDYNIGHSVVSFKVMLPNSKCYIVKPGEPLFNYLIGSYGVLGFVYEITLKIVANDKLRMLDKVLPIETGFDEFKKDIFEGTHHDDNSNDRTHVKFIRLNPKLDKMTYFQYVHTGNVASALDRNPPSISYFSSVIFHWCAHWELFKKIKGLAERITKVHLDAVYKPDNITLVDRNVFAYESPDGVSGKLSHLNATHVLQEYFISPEKDLPYKLMALLKQKYGGQREIELLNTTTRIVKKDEHNFLLSYSPKSDMFAFVLYIRLGLSESAENDLKAIQLDLNEFVTKNGGTFYLPYLHHYTREQILTAYPNMLEYIKFKHQVDPANRFQNKWFQNMEELLKSDLETYELKTSLDTVVSGSTEIEFPTNHNFPANHVYNLEEKSQYIIRNMMENVHLKTNFKMFLQYVFTLHKQGSVMDILEKYSHLDDKKLYLEHLLPYYSNTFSPLSIFRLPAFISRARNTLNFQLDEIQSQIQKIVDFVRVDQTEIFSVLNVGDKGRYHGVYGDLFQNAKRNYVTIDWDSKSGMWFKNMIDEKIGTEVNMKHDIVFSLAGLHHYSLADLDRVLKHCANTVKDKGLFILRDHDVQSEEDNILVRNAHTVFNALAGEKHFVESNELVYFRSKEGWEELLKQYGFTRVIKIFGDDQLESQEVVISELQKHDPTRNFMMCFQYNDPNINTVQPVGKKKCFIWSLFTALFAIATFPFILMFGNKKAPPKSSSDLTFEELGGKTMQPFNSFAQIPEWFNVEYAFEYSKFLVDYPWYLFPFKKANDQMIETCKFAYAEDKKDGVPISSDIIMSAFVITCHCIGCIFSSFFGSLLNSFMKAEDVGGVRNVLVSNPNKYNLEQSVMFNNTKYTARVLQVKNETNEYLVEIPMYRPFTEIAKVWFDSDKDLQITSISGNSKVWVDVKGETIKCDKWAIHTKGSLRDENYKLNIIRLQVTELRELYEVSKQNNSSMIQIYQQ